MLDWFRAAYAIHVLLAVLGAIGFFRYWGKTHFWLPRYVHYLAALALAVGIWCAASAPPNAPISQGDWTGLKKALIALSVPTLVYLFFVFHGGQWAAHERTHPRVRCRNCGGADVVLGTKCPHCGQKAT
jgi:hypothetical protein